jgi:hypothetical protein
MKVIDLQEAKAHLEQYAQNRHWSPVIVTVEAKPTFEMIPIRSDAPDIIDRLLEQNEEFRQLAEERRREVDEGRVSSLESVRRRLLDACA